MQPPVLRQPVSCCSTPGLLNHLAQRTPVALCMWELTPLMQALRIPSGWLYTITQLVTLLQYRYMCLCLCLCLCLHQEKIQVSPLGDSQCWLPPDPPDPPDL